MLYKALRLIRQYHNLSKVDLAKKLSVTKEYLTSIESGKKAVSKELLEQYSTLFDMPVSSLVFFSESLEKEGKYSQKIRTNLAEKALAILEWKIKKNEPKIEA